MACTHPFGVETITCPSGETGVRCPACGMYACPGESWWEQMKRALRKAFGA